jgi:hypothetical protein
MGVKFSMMLVAVCGLSGGAAAQQPSPFPLTVGGSAQRIEWAQVVASPNDDWINDLIPLRNGNILGVGFVNRADGSFGTDWQAVAIEVTPTGRLVSDHRYGAGGGADAFWSMAEAANGNRVFAGFTTRIGPAGINGYVLVSQPDGRIVKENGIGHPGYDRFTDLAPAGDGFVFLGHSQLPDGPRRTYIVKTSAAGLRLWEQIHAGPEAWSALYIEPVEGGFIIAGGTDGGGDSDMFVMKVDGNGRELWRKRVGTADWDEINHGLVVRPDGTLVLVGYTHARGSESNDLVAATLTSDGELVRLERFGGSGDDRALLPKLAADGRLWIAGQTASAGAGGSDLLIASLDANGSFEPGAVTIGGPQDDNGTAILPLGNGLLVAGYSRNLGRGAQDAFIAQLAMPDDKPHPAFKRVVVRPVR